MRRGKSHLVKKRACFAVSHWWAFIDDILVSTKRTGVENQSLVEMSLQKLNRETISLKQPK